MSEENVARARELFATIRVLQRRLFHWYAERAGSTSRPPLCVDLSLPQFNTLNVILEHGTVTIKELAEALHVSAPSASAMVDRLVEMGLAVREQGQEARCPRRGRRTCAGMKSSSCWRWPNCWTRSGRIAQNSGAKSIHGSERFCRNPRKRKRFRRW